MSRWLPISFCLSFGRRFSEISSIGTLLCYDAFEELRHDSFLHNGFEPLLNWKDGGFETFLAFNDRMDCAREGHLAFVFAS